MTEDNIRHLWRNDELDEALTLLRAKELTDQRPLVAANNALLDAVRSIEGKNTPVPETVRVTTPPTGGGGKPVSPSGRRWWIGVAAAAVVVTAGATAAVTGAGHGDPSAPPPSAAVPGVKFASVKQALEVAADKIRVTGETPIPAGKFRYVATRTWALWSDSTIPVAFSAEQLAQTWQPSDFDGEWLLKAAPTGNRKWFVGSEETFKAADAERAAKGQMRLAGLDWPSGEWRAAGGRFSPKALSMVNRGDEPWSAPTEQQLAEWPRDPQKLYDLMAADPSVTAKPLFGGVLAIAAELLKTGTVPADLKEAIYRAVALIPDLKVTEQVANLDGRTGVALGRDPDGTFRTEIIVDPATGEFIGERRTQLKPDTTDKMRADIKPGTVTYSSSVQTTIVDRQGTVPPGS